MKKTAVSIVLLVALSWVSAVNGQTVKTFTGPVATRLQLNGINDNGKMSGYWVNDSTNAVQSVTVDFTTGVLTNIPLPQYGSPGAMLIQKITNLGRMAGDESVFITGTKKEKEHDGVVGNSGALRLFKVSNFRTFGTAVNDTGAIAGYYIDSVGVRGVYYRTSSTSDLRFIETGIVYPGSMDTWVTDLNSSGDLLGYYDTGATTPVHGYVRHAGQFTGIDFPGAISTYPMGFNDAGAVVGSFFFSTDPQAPDHTRHGFTFINGAYTQVDLGGVDIVLTDINAAGQIVGYRAMDSFVITP